MGVQQGAADGGVVDAEFQQSGGEPMCPGTGPSERAGVGGQPRVQAVGDARIDRLQARLDRVTESRTEAPARNSWTPRIQS